MTSELQLTQRKALVIRQRHEIAELIGFETRNKYDVTDAQGNLVAFAAEQQKGIFGFLMRHFLGHWRTFEILFFTPSRQPIFRAKHPFRFFFQRLEIFNMQNQLLGVVQQRFAILSKKFTLLNPQGSEIFRVSSPFWKIWTFPFLRRGREVAVVKKKWSGAFTELLTDKDSFMVEFSDPSLTEEERTLILVSGLFVDIQYFENKAD